LETDRVVEWLREIIEDRVIQIMGMIQDPEWSVGYSAEETFVELARHGWYIVAGQSGVTHLYS
jgi:hypothetical protein